MSASQIKSSIIIPVYNTERYLDECIQSVLQQTQKEIEIILVDDGSTDYSRWKIEQYERQYSNVVAIYQENQKLGAARNAGVRIAKGKYIYFLDSDDYLADDMLERCYNDAEERSLDFLTFDAHAFCEEDVSSVTRDMKTAYNRSNIGVEDNVISGKEYWLKYYQKGGIYTCAPLTYIKREFFLKNKLFFETGIFFEDNDWIARMYIAAERVGYLNQKLYYRRYRNESITVSKYSKLHGISCMHIIRLLVGYLKKTEDRVERTIYQKILSNMMVRINDIVDSLYKTKQLVCMESECIVFESWLADMLMQIWKLENRDKKLYVEFIAFIDKLSKLIEQVNNNRLLLDVKLQKGKARLFLYWKNHFRLHENIRMGIYGTGKMCDQLLEWYRKQGIEILADICFLDSTKVEGQYQGYPVYHVTSIKKLGLEYILIASTRYRNEMLQTLIELGIDEKMIFSVPERFID